MMRRLWIERLERRALLNGAPTLAAGGQLGLTVDPHDYDPESILVRFRDVGQPRGGDLVRGTSMGREFPLVRGLHEIRLSGDVGVEAALAAYRSHPDVIYAEPDYRVRIAAVPDDPMFDQLWGMDNTGQTGGTPDADIDAPAAWEVSTGSGGAVVAVIDTGVDYTHQDLAGNVWTNAAELQGQPGVDDDGNALVDDVYGWDFANHDADPMDDHGHGTHVAGTLGAVGDNGIGVAGVNWDAQIMAVKFLAADGTGTTSAAVDAINYAVAQGALVSNNSWGGNEEFSQALYDAIAAARDAGHVFVAGAGNGWMGIFPLDNDNIPFYPASYDLDNIVAVAATDHHNALAPFSNYGAVSVDLAAPGVDILSTTPGNAYSTMSGTSMATPHVAGTLALIRDLYPELTYRQAIDQVLDNVVPNPVLLGKTSSGGQLNAAAALPAPEQEIRVLIDGVEVADGGAFDFGSVMIGAPAAVTITIQNAGMEDLLLDEEITVPAGFSMAAPLSRTTVPFGEAAVFDVQLDARWPGGFAGDVSITSNDADESPFDFTVSAEVVTALVVDDGQAGFQVTGDWTPHGAEPGTLGDGFLYSAAGSGDDAAAWRFTTSPGHYQVWASWPAYSNRATDAPFTVLDDATALGTVRRNQELAPDDLFDAGVGWESLGTFAVTGNTLKVKLTDDADEYVIADGVRIERAGDLAAGPDVQVAVDGMDVTSATESLDFGSAFLGEPVTKTFAVRNIGLEELVLAETIDVPDGFSLAGELPATNLAPGETTTFQVQLDAARVAGFAGEISLGTNATAQPWTLDVHGSVTAVRIIDNGEDGFAAGSGWTYAYGEGYRDDIQHSAAGSGSDVAVWTFAVPPGEYLVAVTWSPYFNRATDSPFTVHDGGLLLAGAEINQELPPDDFADQGVSWESLGTHPVSGGPLTVRLSDHANEYVIADAVRIQRVDAPPSPEIEVQLDGLVLADGTAAVDFGAALTGQPAARVFHVENVGTADLVLGPIDLPEGFFLVSGPETATLAPGQATTFEVRMDTTAAGSFSGELSLANNDGDEGPFDVVITGSVAGSLIVDNGQAGFTTSGQWTYAFNEGFQGDIQHSPSGTGSNVATWTFAVPPGEYLVAATWSPHPNRATDSPFTVFDGEMAAVTVRVNQELPPDDFSDQAAQWETLATLLVHGDALTVQLANDADQYVIADAVRVQRTGDLPDAAQVRVLLDGADLAHGSGSVDFGATLAGAAVSRTFTVRNEGGRVLNLEQPIVVPDGFGVASSFGAATLQPGQSTTFAVRLEADAAGTFGGQVSFGSNDADQNPFSFQVTGEVTAVQIVDNGQAGFATGGNWTYAFNEGYQGDIQHSPPGSGSNVATWTFSVPPGEYLVAATWSWHPNRATDSPFTIFDGELAVGSVRINQELPPDDFSDRAVPWETLATLPVQGGTLTVQLANDADQYVIADAVRIERVGDPGGENAVQATPADRLRWIGQLDRWLPAGRPWPAKNAPAHIVDELLATWRS